MHDTIETTSLTQDVFVAEHGDMFLTCHGAGDQLECNNATMYQLNQHHRRVRLLVSREVLRLASPVFANMLIYTIEGDEWDIRLALGENMLDFCRVLHKRYDQLSQTIDEVSLYRMALLANKYKATAAVRPFAVSTIKNLIEITDQRGLLSLLVSAHLLSLPGLFAELSSEIVLRSKGRVELGMLHLDFPRSFTDKYEDVLADRSASELSFVFESLQSTLAYFHSQTRRIVERWMFDVLDYNGRLAGDCATHCTAAQQYNFDFTKLLCSRGLWPSTKLATLSLDEVFNTFRKDMANPCSFLHLDPVPCCNACYVCKAPSIMELAEALRAQEMHVRELLPKPCLHCVVQSVQLGLPISTQYGWSDCLKHRHATETDPELEDRCAMLSRQ
ncbi:unnamed protein product [Zymoseptoria tritici ST99CH_1E4]|nr:unnamed protein product [Zymoseptoria tritici ST99CH_1E4]